MKLISIQVANRLIEVSIPDNTQIIKMSDPEPISNPAEAIEKALKDSIGAPGLEQLLAEKIRLKPDSRAVVVISDNTRPVPYRGESGILWPVLKKLLDGGIPKERILILVANGTHRALTEAELREMLDSRVFEAGIVVRNHDCRDKNNLSYLGRTRRGSEIFLNRFYCEADIKILTGLVESHFMAGVSGGRKSVCPGLISEESTYVFHGAPFLASPAARDLNLQDNPCHEEALEVAEKAGADYIINVTLDRSFHLTGVYAGDLKRAHETAAAKINSYVQLPLQREFDIVITHAGFVGINHYQAAKAAVAAIPALKPNGTLVLVANHTDPEPVGSPNYRTLLHLLKIFGAERFERLLTSPDWNFVTEQWQVQMWARLFRKIPLENFIYYSPQISAKDYKILPGLDGNEFLPVNKRYCGSLDTIPPVIEAVLNQGIARMKQLKQTEPAVVFLSDGPYGIPAKMS